MTRRALPILGWLLLAAPVDLPSSRVSAERSDPEIDRLVRLVNRHRAEIDCPQLAWHDRIASVALSHSRDMVEREFYDHVNPDGASLMHRLTMAGIAWNGLAGENLVIGTTDATTAFTLWMQSAEHRSNIENCAFTHHGIGLSDGHWTHVFVQRPLR